MARPSQRDIEYRQRAEAMQWPDLLYLWGQIKKGDTPDWDEGAALEHLVVRAFQLSGLEVEYPYHVPPGGQPLEQIDGLVHLDWLTFLIECKDREGVEFVAIAKLHNQLLRRPGTTLGCVFVSGQFTKPALILASFSVPYRILLWEDEDIETCLQEKDFARELRYQYRQLCQYGLTDYSPFYKDLPE